MSFVWSDFLAAFVSCIVLAVVLCVALSFPPFGVICANAFRSGSMYRNFSPTVKE